MEIKHKNGEYKLFERYDKYERDGDIHWQWYASNKPRYKTLVDDSIKPFLGEGCGRLVDIGCGDGLPMQLLHEMGHKCFGVDSSEVGVKIALMQHNVSGEYFIETAEKFAEKLEERQLEFDYLYSLNTIEHLDKPEVMRDIMKKVRKFGIIVTDNTDMLDPSQRSVYHNIEFSPDTFKKLFEGFGLKRIELSDPNYFGYKVWRL